MPNLNVITWNSTGETAQGAADLQNVIVYMASQGVPPDVIVVQEAGAAPGGAIYQMLAGLGNAFNQPPAHATEGGGPGGRGYLMLTRVPIAGQATFGRYDLGNDAGLVAWINAALSLAARGIAANELAAMRMPAIASLSVGGVAMPWLTWHVPLGPGQVLGWRLGRGANPDAFLFLQNSQLYQALIGPGHNNLGFIAGDLNVPVAELNSATGDPRLPRLLPDWVGVSDDLDHILGHPNAPQPDPTFSNAGHFPASGTHDILVATVSW
jgi:hypothetical protein